MINEVISFHSFVFLSFLSQKISIYVVVVVIIIVIIIMCVVTVIEVKIKITLNINWKQLNGDHHCWWINNDCWAHFLFSVLYFSDLNWIVVTIDRALGKMKVHSTIFLILFLFFRWFLTRQKTYMLRNRIVNNLR